MQRCKPARKVPGTVIRLTDTDRLDALCAVAVPSCALPPDAALAVSVTNDIFGDVMHYDLKGSDRSRMPSPILALTVRCVAAVS